MKKWRLVICLNSGLKIEEILEEESVEKRRETLLREGLQVDYLGFILPQGIFKLIIAPA